MSCFQAATNTTVRIRSLEIFRVLIQDALIVRRSRLEVGHTRRRPSGECNKYILGYFKDQNNDVLKYHQSKRLGLVSANRDNSSRSALLLPGLRILEVEPAKRSILRAHLYAARIGRLDDHIIFSLDIALLGCW